MSKVKRQLDRENELAVTEIKKKYWVHLFCVQFLFDNRFCIITVFI